MSPLSKWKSTDVLKVFEVGSNRDVLCLTQEAQPKLAYIVIVAKVRDWALIMGRGGGLQNRRGGMWDLPLIKGGWAEKVLAML